MVAFEQHLVAIDRDYLSGILVNEVFCPCLKNPGSEFAAGNFLKSILTGINLFGQTEKVEYIFVRAITDCTEQGRDREFFLTVNVCVHDGIDVGRELYPRTFKRNDPGRIQFRAVRVLAHREKHAR